MIFSNFSIFWQNTCSADHMVGNADVSKQCVCSPAFRGTYGGKRWCVETMHTFIFALAGPWYGFAYFLYIGIRFVIYVRINLAFHPCDLPCSKTCCTELEHKPENSVTVSVYGLKMSAAHVTFLPELLPTPHGPQRDCWSACLHMFCLHLKSLPLHTNEWKLQIDCELVCNYLTIKSSGS